VEVRAATGALLDLGSARGWRMKSTRV